MVKLNIFIFLVYTAHRINFILGDEQNTFAWDIITACYGADDRCSVYEMKCPPQQQIILGPLFYGTKQYAQLQCTFGVADCQKTSIICCSYNETDIFRPFSDADRTNITDHCTGKQTCKGSAPRLAEYPYSSYVRMNYTCSYGVSESQTRTTSLFQTRTSSTTQAYKPTNPHSIHSTVSEADHIILSSTSPTSFGTSTDLKPLASKRSTIKVPLVMGTFSNSLSTINPLLSSSHAVTMSHSRTAGLVTLISSTISSQRQPNGVSSNPISTGTPIDKATGAPRTFDNSLSTHNPLQSNTYTKNSSNFSETTVNTLMDTRSEGKEHISSTTQEILEVPTKDDDELDKGLIIGLIIGILAALAIIVGIIICLCIRVKRKEQFRRNYIRNTNIFYSFPDDLKDTGSTLSDCKSVETIEHNDTLVIETNGLYEPLDGIESPYDTCSEFNVDKYIIRRSNSGNNTVASTDSSINASDREDEVEPTSYDNRVNNAEPGTSRKPQVTFDASALYASVKKEGKTKF